MSDDKLADAVTEMKDFMETLIIQRTSGLATKDDIENMATKDDIANMATKDDIAELKAEIREVKTAIEDTVLPYIEEVDAQVQKHDKILRKLKAA